MAFKAAIEGQYKALAATFAAYRHLLQEGGNDEEKELYRKTLGHQLEGLVALVPTRLSGMEPELQTNLLSITLWMQRELNDPNLDIEKLVETSQIVANGFE